MLFILMAQYFGMSPIGSSALLSAGVVGGDPGIWGSDHKPSKEGKGNPARGGHWEAAAERSDGLTTMSPPTGSQSQAMYVSPGTPTRISRGASLCGRRSHMSLCVYLCWSPPFTHVGVL